MSVRRSPFDSKNAHSSRPSSVAGSSANHHSRPMIVFADEPTGNLDSRTSGEILELLRLMVEGFGQTTLMVTHDPEAAAIADRVLFIDDGKLVHDLPRASAADIVRTMEELRA